MVMMMSAQAQTCPETTVLACGARLWIEADEPTVETGEHSQDCLAGSVWPNDGSGSPEHWYLLDVGDAAYSVNVSVNPMGLTVPSLLLFESGCGPEECIGGASSVDEGFVDICGDPANLDVCTLMLAMVPETAET